LLIYSDVHHRPTHLYLGFPCQIIQSA
jgi:hypothetical protein